MALDEAARATVAPYVSSPTADVFALVGLPEEDVAVLFAYASKNPSDLRANLARLLADQKLEARPFREQTLSAHGRAALAEHATIHLGIEGASIIASKLIEDLRLGSYTERFTRHTPIDDTSLVPLPQLGALEPLYKKSAERLLATYVDFVPKVAARLVGRVPENLETRAVASDLLRGLLPGGTKTQIGFSANARSIAGLVTKLLSHPLAEAKRLGEAMRNAAVHVAPMLIQTGTATGPFVTEANASAYRAGMGAAVAEALRRVYTPPEENTTATLVVTQPVRLVRYDRDALDRVALALTYEGSDPRAHASGLIDGLRHATANELEEIVKAALAGRGPRDPAPRAFEASAMTFELMMDYASYRDLQRHRMLTPATQRLTCRLGFETPPALADLGGYEAYGDAMLAARDIWAKLEATHPLEAQYAVPIGYRVRMLWTMSLREVFHIVETRSKKGVHPSVRRIAQALYRTTVGALPWLDGKIRVDLEESLFGF